VIAGRSNEGKAMSRRRRWVCAFWVAGLLFSVSAHAFIGESAQAPWYRLVERSIEGRKVVNGTQSLPDFLGGLAGEAVDVAEDTAKQGTEDAAREGVRKGLRGIFNHNR
jgi:hypothetical protein